MGESPCLSYLSSRIAHNSSRQSLDSVEYHLLQHSHQDFLYKSASSVRTISSSANMSTSSNGLFQREGKVVVAALLLAMLCGPVGGSRFMKSPASARRTMARLPQSPPPPPPPGSDVDDPFPPPPPDSVQFPPPIHHRVRPPPSNASSPPPVSLQPPSHPPPSRLHRSPPPPPSSPPPPPPDENTRLPNNQNGRRRLLTSSSDQELSGSNTFLTQADASPGKCTDADTGAPLIPYGGAYVPVGAPFSYGDPEVPSPEPAPSPTSGADGPALPPTSGDNSTLAHTTMVSAMKFNQCTYTIIMCTGNIEGAGTQADVNVEFFDKYGDSVLFVNLKSQNRNFNRGATDTFTVVGDCVQNICRMHLSHDDSGPNPGWFVNTVTVSLMYQTHVFNVFEWLAKDEPPYSLSRTVSSCPA